MNIYETIKNTSLEDLASMLGRFMAYECEDGKSDVCLMKKNGFCGYPTLDCKESACNWLLSESVPFTNKTNTPTQEQYRAKQQVEIKEITPDEAEAIITARHPLGLFVCKDQNKYVGIDNSDGDAWTEDFSTLKECLTWLQDCD